MSEDNFWTNTGARGVEVLTILQIAPIMCNRHYLI